MPDSNIPVVDLAVALAPDSNIPVVDLAAALAPDRLAAWLDYVFADHASNAATLAARHAKFLVVTKDGISDDVMAGHATDFAKDLRAESAATDATRTRVKAPVLHAQRLIDGTAKALVDKLGLCRSQVETRITEFLRAKEAKARAEAEAEAARLQAEADAKFAEAAQAGAEPGAVEAAIEAIDEAQQAEQRATAPTIELTRTRSQMGALTGLKDNWTYEVVDLSKVPAHLLMVNDAAVRLAIKQGSRDLAGLRIWNDAKVFVR